MWYLWFVGLEFPTLLMHLFMTVLHTPIILYCPQNFIKVYMKDIRIAVVVTHSHVGDTAGDLKRTASWIKAAARQGAAIICFPELNLTGYFSGPGIQKYAEPIPGPASDFVTDIARKNNITVLAGMAESDSMGRIYATHIVVQPDGTFGVYRKLHLGPPERGAFTPGGHTPLFDIEGFRFGVQLCYDAHFPELSTRMAIDGADAIFMPHASPGPNPKQKQASWMRHLPARAYDNGVFVIACNPCGDNGKGLHFPGVAVVLDPLGNLINSYIGESEHMIIADLKAETLQNIRHHKMRYFLPNRRPEIYKLK
jgi:N-carbamoylputrescine amidase